MLPGPVFNAELLITARRARYYAVRFVYGIILLFFIWQNDPEHGAWGSGTPAEMTAQDLARLGRALFSTFLIVQSLAVLLLTPALVAGTIADEKQRKTLHYLLASPLTSGEIILGKLAARMLHLLVFVALGLPIMSLLSLFGGVDPLLVLLSFAATLTTAFFLSGLSILVSTHARRPREAISLVYMLEVCWFFGPAAIAVLTPIAGPRWAQFYQWIRPVIDWVQPTSPLGVFSQFGMFGTTNAQQLLAYFGWMMGLQTAYGIVFVVIALLRMRRVHRNEGGGRTSAWFASLRRGRRLLPRPACGADAMMWKERYVSRTSLAVKLIAAFIGCGLFCGLAYLTYDFAKPAFIELAEYGLGATGSDTARRAFNGYLRFVCTLIYILFAMAVASGASSGLTSEREEDTWTSLVATPLDGLEVVRAKMIGTVWGHRWLAGVLVLLWSVGLAAGAVHPIGFVAVVLDTVVFIWFATALGTYYSLRAKSSARALLGVMATLLAINGGYLMCCIPLELTDWAWVVFGVTPALEALSLASYQDMHLLLGGTENPGHEQGALAVVFGTIVYAIAAAHLTYRAVARFDVEAGRARRAGRIPPPRQIAIKHAIGDERGDPEESSV